MTRREIGLGVLALGALAVWIYYQNRSAAAGASAALAANPSSSGTANSDANTTALGDASDGLNDGSGSFG